MSSAMNKSTTKKPFCKVCFHAGNDFSHPLRNNAGQTVCTYLLNLQCRNCGKCGHTVKYCKDPKKHKQQQMSTDCVSPAQISSPKQKPPKQKSQFDVLQKLIEEDEKKESERESEELAQRLKEIAHKTNFPDISKKTVAKKASDSILTGWNRVVGKSIKVYETLSEEEDITEEEQKQTTAETTSFNPYIVGSWADY